MAKKIVRRKKEQLLRDLDQLNATALACAANVIADNI
jgi:hypothetical protein